MRFALACSRFNGSVTEALMEGATEALLSHGVAPGAIIPVWAPGAFELPLVAWHMATSKTVDAVICLGAVIRGETGHYEHVSTQCAAGLQRVQLDTGVPVLFGVLTTDNALQAMERADPSRANKGAEVALAALEMIELLRRLPC